ncbi:hypothetical protein QTO34_018371 [Cnephaeus nilssonii]|uniref:Uncharacterized protein n=1 Tax=Cnephaeus nilssonii TaxID=3371016 RepID=A0AA40HYP8_CNENI|nr:hypothetical protein QTO34_018371 [Eptesicus nilssonii]
MLYSGPWRPTMLTTSLCGDSGSVTQVEGGVWRPRDPGAAQAINRQVVIYAITSHSQVDFAGIRIPQEVCSELTDKDQRGLGTSANTEEGATERSRTLLALPPGAWSRSVGSQQKVAAPHLGTTGVHRSWAAAPPQLPLLVTVCGVIGGVIGPTRTCLGLALPAHLLHHPTVVLLLSGPIWVSSTSTATAARAESPMPAMFHATSWWARTCYMLGGGGGPGAADRGQDLSCPSSSLSLRMDREMEEEPGASAKHRSQEARMLGLKGNLHSTTERTAQPALSGTVNQASSVTRVGTNSGLANQSIPKFTRYKRIWCRKVTTTYWTLKQEITSLVHKLKGERSKCSRKEEEMVEMLKTLSSLEEAVKISTSQAAVPNPPGWPPPQGWTWVLKQRSSLLSTQASPAASCATCLCLHLRIPETSGASLGWTPPPPHAVHSAQLLQDDPSTYKGLRPNHLVSGTHPGDVSTEGRLNCPYLGSPVGKRQISNNLY